MRIGLALRSVIAVVVIAAVATIMAIARTKPFDCDEFKQDGNISNLFSDDLGPRGMGCLFRKHVNTKTSAVVTQEGRIRRDTDTFFWSLFANAFAANPNTPYLYMTLPMFTFGGSWWPKASFLPSPMWRFIDKRDVAVFIGELPPETVYTGFTTFALWRPFRFVFASLGDSSNGLNLRYDPETRLFAYVICFGDATTAKADAEMGTTPEHNTPSAYGAVMETLTSIGLPENAINVQVLDPNLLQSDWTYYELVLRIFHFQNQTEGSHFLQPQNHNHPFFYISAGEDEKPRENRKEKWLIPPAPTGFKSTFHPKSVSEKEELAESFNEYGRKVVSDIHRRLSKTSREETKIYNEANISLHNYTNHSFGVLNVAAGSGCLRDDTECLGGCPDAAYFGLNVGKNSSQIFETLSSWPTLHELHIVTVVDHRARNNSVYGSLALLGSSSKYLDPGRLTRSVRATSVGVTSLELFQPANDKNIGNEKDGDGSGIFATWVFTRNPDHCRILSPSSSHHVYGCTVIDSKHLSLSTRYVTYLERIYLNPLTATRPDPDKILPARLYRVRVEHSKKKEEDEREGTAHKRINDNNQYFSKIRLPPSHEVITFDGDEPLRFLHIIKTGGESLENYIWREPSLRIDYGACFAAATKVNRSSVTAPADNLFTVSASSLRRAACNALATLTSSALCGLNCECCASDLFAPESNDEESSSTSNPNRKFHGTLLRSPRAHVLSQFSHCHAAHHSSWRRMLGDLPLYAAEGILRLTEDACDSSCDLDGNSNWFRALERRLETDELKSTRDDDSDSDSNSNRNDNRVLVISIHNTQSHALTCGKDHGSFGHHFKRIVASRNPTDDGQISNIVDEYTPSLEHALSALDKFEWFGITELFMPSLCLLHYQTNQKLPPKCDCDSPDFVGHNQPGALGYWKETRSTKRSTQDLTPTMLKHIDEHTRIDGGLYARAVRVFLGKLRTVEAATGTSLLKCIDWADFRSKTGYLTELWTSGPNGLLV